MGMGSRRAGAGAGRLWIRASCTALLLSACKSGGTGVTVSPPSCASSAGTPIALAVGAYITLDPASNQGCARFPANTSTTDSAEYLVVPQSAATSPNAQSSFTLTGGAGTPAPPVRAQTPRPGRQASFDAFLRRTEATRSYGPRVPVPSTGG